MTTFSARRIRGLQGRARLRTNAFRARQLANRPRYRAHMGRVYTRRAAASPGTWRQVTDLRAGDVLLASASRLLIPWPQETVVDVQRSAEDASRVEITTTEDPPGEPGWDLPDNDWVRIA